jgi:ATP-dependent helicase HrpA
MAAELVDTAPVRALRGQHPARVAGKGGRPSAEEILGRAALGKAAAQVTASERATLYGLVVYSQRRINYGKINPAEAREIFIRDALVGGDFETRAVLRAQPEAGARDREPGTQVAPPGRAGGR